MKIKVNRLQLIAALEKKRIEFQKKVDEAQKTALKPLQEWIKNMEAYIKIQQKKLDNAKKVKTEQDYIQWHNESTGLNSCPYLPNYGDNQATNTKLRELTRVLAGLKMSAEEFLICADDDNYLKYL